MDSLRHLILPAIALGTIPLAIIMRITRASVIDVMNEDYVRTANAKGLSGRVVDNRHVLRNALLPVITVIGLQIGLLLGGAILTETIFGWGGVGKWIYDAVVNNDYQVIQSGVLLLASDLHPGQPGGRRQLRLPEPEDPLLVSQAATTIPAVAEEDKPLGLWTDALQPHAAQPGGAGRRPIVALLRVHGHLRAVPGALRPDPRQPGGQLPAARRRTTGSGPTCRARTCCRGSSSAPG